MPRPPSAIATADSRLTRGRTRGDAHFPAAPAHAGLPSDYGRLLADLKQRIAQQRLRVVLASYTARLELYADIGRTILDRQSAEGWGAKVIDRLSVDLKAAFPDMTGFSTRNLVYMRTFAAAWPRREFTQAPLAQLSWNHHRALLDKLKTAEDRLWYAAKSAEHGWSRNILALQIEGQAKRLPTVEEIEAELSLADPAPSPAPVKLTKSPKAKKK